MIRWAALAWLAFVALTLPGLRHLDVDFDLAELYASFTGEAAPGTTDVLWVLPGAADVGGAAAALERIPGVVQVRAPQPQPVLLASVPKSQRAAVAHVLRGKPATDVHALVLTLRAADPPLEAIEATGDGDLVGLAVMNRAHAASARSEQIRLVLAVSAGLFLALCALFRRVGDALLVVLSVGSGAVALAGTMGWLGLAFGGPNLMLLPLLIVLGLADTLHLLRAFADTDAVADRSRHALARVALPCVLTSATTALAFLALLSSSSAPVRQFGGLAAYGMGLALVSGLALPAWVLEVFPSPGPRRWADGAAMALASRMRRLPLGFGLLLIPLALGAAQVRPDLQLGGELPDGDRDLLAQQRVDTALGGVFPLRFVVETGEAGGVSHPDAAARLLQLHQRLEKDPAVGAVLSYADVLAWVAQARGKRADQLVGSRGSRSPTRLRRFEKVYRKTLEAGVEEAALPLFDDDRSAYLVHARFRDVGARAWEVPVAHLEGYARAQAEVHVEMEGYVPLAVATLRQLPVETARVVGVSMFSAWLVVGLRHRRLRAVLPVPLILGGTLLAALGTMGALEQPLNHTNLFVLSLASGLGVDAWLHLQAQGHRAAPAIVWTTAVLCVGFVALQASALPTVRGIGLVLLVATLCNAALSLGLHRLGRSAD